MAEPMTDPSSTADPAAPPPREFGAGPPSAFAPPTPWRRRLQILGWIIAAGLALLMLAIGWLAVTAPLSRSLRPIAPPSISLMSTDGHLIARRGAVIDTPVTIAQLPAHVPQAFMAIEDRRFYSHWGVDPRGIARAAWHNLWSDGSSQGGSTITQQLAKGVFLSSDRTMGRKAREAMIAFWLEAWLTKDQILERYLSNVYFGDNVYGLRAAALHYFNRAPERLTIPQAAMLAGLLKAPSRLAPTSNLKGARARAALVTQAMVDAGYLTQAERNALPPVRLNVRETPDATTGTYFADWVLPDARDRAGAVYGEQKIDTTLDWRIQRLAEAAVRRAPLGGAQAALVAMKPDGSVVAMVGGKNYAKSSFNRAVQARRQPGSTFKLFVYLAAFRAGMTPEDMIDDTPITTGSYRPANHGGKYRGRISLRQAFAASSNVAAVRLTQKVGVDNVIKVARDLGVTAPLTEDLSLALGTSEIPLIELAEAYAAVAAGSYPVLAHGLPPEERGWFERLMARQRAFDDDELAMIRDLLSSAANRGTGSAAALRTSTFGKTGTTQDSRDAIFVGYAGGLVTAVWIGNDDNSPLPGGAAGGGIPARIWRNFMSGAINEAVEDAPVETQDADLVNAIANISVETGIGNVGLGVDEGGMTVNVGPAQIRLPTDQPAPPADTAPPRIAPTQPPQGEDSGA
ncbi:MAG: PBP1A family penicillin-binding protein [Sphingobium sp.]|uniref:transglycosylase domain-containing protein n=1 Tax=Sphingobium sp. TaxID=1912891 RepID=UPI000C3D942C|nr:PBP1A family penicillin-binding protein [Sphingobium sp.]MBU0658804.1 PBP1A family penicillin-binding protein [Alphaproteobacteria bacterium]MBA4754941.1 PBP1A family penicillin-binding protein [Sphingobium sp.]MBS87110.1 penicillin-binding protein [Sphingobium sp.]MBU0867932.1 PBP1A family penicillin-binding protein [Alphaproteobacteria bacterium]MBU1259339.1 PBP1A family penicillin-binding protein [Alphaproteobacteria bacterium]